MAKSNSVSTPTPTNYLITRSPFTSSFLKRVICALGVSNFLPLHYSQSSFCSHSSLKMGKVILAKINLIFRLLNPTDTSQSHLRRPFWYIFQLRASLLPALKPPFVSPRYTPAILKPQQLTILLIIPFQCLWRSWPEDLFSVCFLFVMSPSKCKPGRSPMPLPGILHLSISQPSSLYGSSLSL